MADEKYYTARQVTQAVLDKVTELIKKSPIFETFKKAEGEKGVHQPAVGWAPYEHGTSPAGIMSQMGSGPKSGAIKEHQRVLSELKRMPDPKLPKSEDMGKAETENPKKENAKPSKHDSKNAFKDSNGKAPKGEIRPKEQNAGEIVNPEERIESQLASGKNPKEQAEGNNELAGTTPTQVGEDGKNKPGYDEMKSHLKLAKWIGRMEYKRNLKKSEHKET